MYLEDFKTCHSKIVDTFQYIVDNYKSAKFQSYPLHECSTSFILVNENNVKISIACPIDTCGELETFKFNNNNEIDNDTLEYHENNDKLLEYIKLLK